MGIELAAMVSGGFHSSLSALAPTIEKLFGVVLTVVGGPSMGSRPDAIPNRLARGESADMLVMVADSLDTLVAQGRARNDTRCEVARSPIGMAVKRGAIIPDISTEDALRQTLSAAASIGYSDSASGRYVSGSLFNHLGLEALAAKSCRIEETPVAEIVASGKVALGFQEVAEILPVRGAQLIGKLPSTVELITPYAAAVSTNGDRANVATRVVRFLASPSVWPLIEAEGLMPPHRAAS